MSVNDSNVSRVPRNEPSVDVAIDIAAEKAMTRKVLRKLDLHVLPPLALVRQFLSAGRTKLTIIHSSGWPILL